jgi:peptidoglycan hydrolase-like protein with peptidoglycan-binding domain
MLQTWIADKCRYYGLDVVEVDGWRTRGSSSFDPYGVVCHHTAGSPDGEMPSLRLLINGRSDLPGPLCNVALGRSGKVYVVAAGRANHAGAGGWHGLVGNSSVLGIEAESTGSADGQNWTAEQRRVYPILAAALKAGAKSPTDFSIICAHREWAPTRKVDPRGIDMPSLRDTARRFDPRPPPPPPPPPSADNFKERVMAKPVLSRGATGQDVKVLQGLLCVHAADLVAWFCGGWDKTYTFIDGNMGDRTVAVLVEWQKRTQTLASDGVCGPATWAWLVGV